MTSWHTMPTMGGVALRALGRHPDRVAFSGPSGTLTYAGAADLIGRFQRALAGRGLTRGQRVALLGANRAESWCAAIAAQASGLAISWLHPLGSLDDHLAQVADLDAAAVIVDGGRHGERGAELAAKADGVTMAGIGPVDFGEDLLAVAGAGGTATPADVAHPDDVAAINYTGGTTGRPKGALRRHPAAVMVNLVATLADFELPPQPRYLAVAPISHVAGTKVLPTLARGGTVYLDDGFDPDRVLDTIARRRISMTLLVPTMIVALLDRPALDTADLSSLQLLLYGAAPMPPTRLAEAAERIGPVLCQLYGQTECYPITVLPREDHGPDGPAAAGSCGVPVSTCQVALLDADGHPAAPGGRGEVCVRGPGVMEEYWQRPALTAEAFASGWLHTGDIAEIDERGYLHLVDRAKDMIISGGFNVYPKEVEDALSTHTAVAAAAVFGVSDDRWGEAVTAAVVLHHDAAATPEDLIRHVRDHKGPLLAPKTIHIVPALPTTAVGKTDKRALRAAVEKGAE
ncbi:MAG TPA: AMP-binding protein [Acidimicrobiia bacterium]|nr:AMP-binding protein [Acidimicrobiia bacterium]